MRQPSESDFDRFVVERCSFTGLGSKTRAGIGWLIFRGRRRRSTTDRLAASAEHAVFNLSKLVRRMLGSLLKAKNRPNPFAVGRFARRTICSVEPTREIFQHNLMFDWDVRHPDLYGVQSLRDSSNPLIGSDARHSESHCLVESFRRHDNRVCDAVHISDRHFARADRHGRSLASNNLRNYAQSGSL